MDSVADKAVLRDRIAVEVSDELLELALTHRSYAYENGGLPTNERLEFLGDSVLGIVVTDTLYRRYPDLPEGQLARMRAAVVNSKSLADAGRTIGLGEFIRLGRGERTTGGANKASILADTVEAVIGAVYLDDGLAGADALVHRLVDPLIDRAAELGAGLDWKSSLQELAARESLGVPEYRVGSEGPPHDREFTAAVVIDGEVRGQGSGRSKKDAEHVAAEQAWKDISAASTAHPNIAG